MFRLPGESTRVDDVSILVVDAHVLVRDGLRRIVEEHSDLRVVEEASSGYEAVAVAADKQPEIVLLGVEDLDDDVAVTVNRIRQVSPGSRTIVLPMTDNPRVLRRLLAIGIGGYLSKSATRQGLVAAIRYARHNNGTVLLAASAEVFAEAEDAEPDLLSAREREILELAAEARTNSQISRELHLSEATVKRHLRNIFSKLGAVSRIDAVNKAVAASLISSARL